MSTVASQDQHQQSSEADDNRPLSQDEFALLQRLLSDPLSLPQPYKTWLVSWIEGSNIQLAMSSVHGLTSALGISTARVGTRSVSSLSDLLLDLQARVAALEAAAGHPPHPPHP